MMLENNIPIDVRKIKLTRYTPNFVE